MKKQLSYLIMAAALVWIISEILEIVQGSYTPLILWLTALFHLLAGIGIWGLHLGQTKEKNKWSFYGAFLLSIGYAVLTIIPLTVMYTSFSAPGEVAAAYPALKLFGLISVLGVLLFGSAIIKIKYFPVWTGILFIICSLVTFSILATQGNILIANISNILVSLAMIKMGWQVI